MKKRNYYFTAGRWPTDKESKEAKNRKAVMVNGSMADNFNKSDIDKCYGLVPEHLLGFKPRTRKAPALKTPEIKSDK